MSDKNYGERQDWRESQYYEEIKLLNEMIRITGFGRDLREQILVEYVQRYPEDAKSWLELLQSKGR